MFLTKSNEAFPRSESSGEKLVYEKAATELGDDYYVFHDFAWNDPSLKSSKKTGQIDFVIVNPEFGYLCLEVKGGRCSYDAKTNCWITHNGDQKQHEIKDPFEQALVASKVLLELLLREKQMFIPHSHAVIFPDCVFPGKGSGGYLKASVQMWQLLDREDLFDFGKSMRFLFQKAFPGRRIGRSDGMRIIEVIKSLHKGTDLKGLKPTSAQIREAHEKIITLTDKQVGLLYSLRDNKRQLILGCAGSGKTMLAIHKAKSLAEEGKKVLLLCFNVPLGEYLEQECSSSHGITAGPFLELCIAWLKAACVDVRREDTEDFYEILLPNLVAEHLKRLPSDFDAIVVDEAQDFKEGHWKAMQLLFKDFAESHFYIFADSNQNIYGGSAKYPVETPSFRLEKNVRNTNQIFQVVASCCMLDDTIRPSGVNGPPVELDFYKNSQDMLKKIETFLARLVKEATSIDDLVILGTKNQRNTCLRYGTKIGPFTLQEKHSKKPSLMTMSYRRFKGLESKVIILCELEEGVKDLREVLYVGMTRSTGMLILLVKESFREALESIGLSLNNV